MGGGRVPQYTAIKKHGNTVPSKWEWQSNKNPNKINNAQNELLKKVLEKALGKYKYEKV